MNCQRLGNVFELQYMYKYVFPIGNMQYEIKNKIEKNI